MKYFGDGISEKHKELNKIIRRPSEIEAAKSLFLEIHALLNESGVSGTDKNEVDELLGDLTDDEYAIMPTRKDETIAWVLWHIARIEDLTTNFLIARQDQIFNQNWKEKLGISVSDTGNAFSDDEIMKLSKEINKKELLKYRHEVAKRTRSIVSELSTEDMKRKIAREDLENIILAGGVTQHPDSIWLIDFWGKKDVAGILLLPPTRHVMLHLNACCKWKGQIRKKIGDYLNEEKD